MTIRQQGGVFGRNPTFNDVTVDGTLTVDQIVEKTGAAGITLDGVTLKDGNVVLADGKGIDFSATSGSGTSELLDDYEEGTWTPVISDATSGGNTGTATVSFATYTKVGNVVYLKAQLIDINTTGLTGASNLYVQGLPFVADGTSFGSLNASFLTASANCIGVNSNIQAGTNYVRTTEKISGGSYLVIDVSQFTSGTADIWISITYHT